jgi:tetratricopeptide (TPR) repeat protein
MRHTYHYRIMGRRSRERAAAARAAAERAVELAPESEDAQVAMGIYLYYVERDYEQALDWLSRASGSLFGDYQYHRHRAQVERAMGHWEQALASYEAAVSLSPRDRLGWTNFGSTYLFLRRYADAEETLLEALRLDDAPHAAVALLTWFRDGTTDAWGPYLDRNATSEWAWEIPMTEGRYEDAMAVLQDLPDVLAGEDPWYPKALLEAETLEASGEHEAAREKYQDAADILEREVEDAPADERYRRRLARAFAGLGRRDEAVRQAHRAVEIMPRERHALTGPESLFNLAAIHARLGEVDEALEVLENLLSAPSRYAPNMLEDHHRLRAIQADPRFIALMDRERNTVF